MREGVRSDVVHVEEVEQIASIHVAGSRATKAGPRQVGSTDGIGVSDASSRFDLCLKAAA
jgi:hypothetical protein